MKFLAPICIFFLFVLGCCHQDLTYLPGEQEGDENCVWVCTEPFAFFSLDDDVESDYYGELKGYIESEEGFVEVYSIYDVTDKNTYFAFPEFFKENSSKYSFRGDAYYYKDYFDFTTEDDFVNFFGGELPSLRFDKMTKEEFAEKYENLSEFIGSK